MIHFNEDLGLLATQPKVNVKVSSSLSLSLLLRTFDLKVFKQQK